MQIDLPDDLIRQLDELVTPQARTAFIIDTLVEAIQHHRTQEEIAQMAGSFEWVRQMRREHPARFDRIFCLPLARAL